MPQRLLVENTECPFQLAILDEAHEENQFHSEIELIFLLSGEVVFSLGNERYTLRARDFIFSNTYEFHSLHTIGTGCRYVRILIAESRLRYLFSTSRPMLFQWQESLNNRQKPLYRRVVSDICSMVVDAVNRQPGYLAAVYQKGLDIISCLNQYCRQTVTEENPVQKLASQQQKACDIMDYLNNHYMEQISLNDLSNMVYLSAPYISKIFKDNFRIGFLEYLNRLRIQKSLGDLRNSSRHIIDIAMDCGFANAKTYSRVFQNEMGISPSDYRKQHTEGGECEKGISLVEGEELVQLLELSEQLKNMMEDNREYEALSVYYDFAAAPAGMRKQPWSRVLNAGTASLLLHRRAQDEISLAAKDLGMSTVRITGVLSDLLQIYNEDTTGNMECYWGHLDEIVDFLLDNHLKPFLCLGFMPEKLAFEKTESPYFWKANTSKPASMKKWCAYLAAVLKHLVHRYSYEEVCSWNFEFWSNPELRGVFWHGSREEFLEFFLASYRVFREVLPEGRFGSPGLINLKEYTGTRWFLDNCKKNKVRFDLFCLHLYDLTDPNNQEIAVISSLKEGQEEIHGWEYILRSVESFRNLIRDIGYSAPIYVTEWNVSPYFHDLSRDTCFMAAYIADVINHLPDYVQSISFQSLSDYSGEHQPNQIPFTGELGMRTASGLAKPSYLMFKLLSMMGEEVLESGGSYMVTRSRHGWHVLLYNVTFFSEEFMNGTSRRLSVRDRYQIFDEKPNKQFNLHLTLPSGYYRVERHILSRKHGSVYDSWADMGGPSELDSSTHWLLNKCSFPKIQVKYQNITDRLLLSEKVPLHGVEMISLIRMGDELTEE